MSLSLVALICCTQDVRFSWDALVMLALVMLALASVLRCHSLALHLLVRDEVLRGMLDLRCHGFGLVIVHIVAAALILVLRSGVHYGGRLWRWVGVNRAKLEFLARVLVVGSSPTSRTAPDQRYHNTAE